MDSNETSLVDNLPFCVYSDISCDCDQAIIIPLLVDRKPTTQKNITQTFRDIRQTYQF